MAESVLAIEPHHLRLVHEILNRHVPTHEVWAFGSRVTGTHKEYSDLDLAIITCEPMSISTAASLSDAFSQSDLPYKVDLVDWASTSDSFRQIIEGQRVVVRPISN